MDINREIAEKVMGWKYIPERREQVGEQGVIHYFAAHWTDNSQLVFYEFQWHPSTNIAQAFMVVEKMRELRPDGSDGFNFNLNWQGHKGITFCLAQFHRISGNLEHGQGSSDDPAEAICLAALKAVRKQLDL